MSIRTLQELKGMQASASVVAQTLKAMRMHAKPGMSTKALDEFGYSILSSHGAVPAPKQQYGFPGWTCISVNDEAAHGIPSDHKILHEGDLVNIDVSAVLNGYFADNGGSFVLGNDIHNYSPLVDASKEILRLAIENIRGGVRIAAVGALIEREAKRRGFTSIKNLTGHGIGYALHEAPLEIPCFHDRFNRDRFKTNSVIALETFISTKARIVETARDGWTLRAKDGSRIAQHEHTLLITDSSPVILTEENDIWM